MGRLGDTAGATLAGPFHYTDTGTDPGWSALYTFHLDLREWLADGTVQAFGLFFLYVWALWGLKTLGAFYYRPRTDVEHNFTATVIVPVYKEATPRFERVLRSVRSNNPQELIVAVDGGDSALEALSWDYADQVLSLPKCGKRSAVHRAFRASVEQTDAVVVLDSDTIWTRGLLYELLRPFTDLRVGGVTPRQSVFNRDANAVRRFADWLEDLRYTKTVPAQSAFGQVGCLAGRTIAYRRSAFEGAIEALVHQRVLGVEMHVGDDRVLTNELLRRGWRTIYQSTATVETDAPNDWRTFWRQQLRWGRSSQRETILSLSWLWRRPAAFACFITDIFTPFALYTLFVVAAVRMSLEVGGPADKPLPMELALAYAGMLGSIGLRQVGHLRRHAGDVPWLLVFVLLLTFFMAPLRIAAFATMFHQSWRSRSKHGGVRAAAVGA